VWYRLPNEIALWIGELLLARKSSRDHSAYRMLLKACMGSIARFGGALTYEDFERDLARKIMGLVCREKAFRASTMGLLD